MQGPAFLPPHLLYCESFETEEGLFQALTQKPADLVAFFELACADETWCEEHIKLVRTLFRWGAKSYYLSQLPLLYAQRMVKTVQEHYTILKPLLYFRAALFFTVVLTIEHQEIVINSFMFGVSSQFFTELFKINCFNKMRDDWSISDVSFSMFHLVEEHILKGEIGDLWKHSYIEVLALMRLAKRWRFFLLVKECAAILHRYINRENVIETLLQAHRQFFIEWKQDCCEFFNKQGWGIRFLPGRETDLRIEFLDFKQETLEIFELLSPWVTHLVFSEHLSESPFFSELIHRCPKLIGINLSGTSRYIDQFEHMPAHLLELNFSACPWITSSYLAKASRYFPRLKELYLDSDAHLTYIAWGELHHFHQLNALHLKRCYQLTDEDLKLISQACSYLVEIDLEECRFGDRGITDLIHNCQRLTVLDLSRCYQLTDRSLIELSLHAYYLTHLSLVRCSSFSDKSLLQLLQLRPTLKYLNVKGCNFSLNILEQARHDYPLLELID
jgi:F-box/leucine-rich repeat protein 2/20